MFGFSAALSLLLLALLTRALARTLVLRGPGFVHAE
jgi:hypothetical protein